MQPSKRLIDNRPDLFMIDNFLTKSECAQLIAFSENAGYEEALITGHDGKQYMFKQIRNNDRYIWDDQNLAQQWWQRAQAFLPGQLLIAGLEANATGVNERFRFYRYTAGQRFSRHRDGSFARSEKEVSVLTFMVYLNEGFEGGATRFDLPNRAEPIVITPVTGSALVFVHPLLHEGQEVVSGVKYVLRTDVMYSVR